MSRGCAALMILFGCGVPVGVASAQVGLFGHHACSRCAQPVAQCHCQTVRPVVRTHLEAQQVVTHRPVAQTHYRQEHVVQRVPVVRHTNVTVDEGSYKMVWVPRPVTRQIATVECRDQVATRTVPYTVVRNVPQISTRLVPRQTVSYVRQQYSVAMPVARPIVAVAPRPHCSSCAAAASTAWQPAMTAPVVAAPIVTTPIAARPYTTVPTPMATPSPTLAAPAAGSVPPPQPLYEQARLPEIDVATAPVPDPAFSTPAAGGATADSGAWTTIAQRKPTPSAIPRTAQPAPTAIPARTASRFTPAVPSAATVWQSNGTVRR